MIGVRKSTVARKVYRTATRDSRKWRSVKARPAALTQTPDEYGRHVEAKTRSAFTFAIWMLPIGFVILATLGVFS